MVDIDKETIASEKWSCPYKSNISSRVINDVHKILFFDRLGIVIFKSYFEYSRTQPVGDEMETIGLMTDHGHIVLSQASAFSSKGMGMNEGMSNTMFR